MTASAAAELSATLEHVSRYRERVAVIARSLSAPDAGDHHDVVAALFEAERSLRTAARAVERATKMLGR
ncbi:MAG: hypothetical protein AAB131_15990 [Actinomycetota bacterium]|jgi:flagellar hook-basal body complex protein FliE|nr:MAG: hypothetical protein FD127_1643 [Acidimicrobiaceae bacterium]